MMLQNWLTPSASAKKAITKQLAGTTTYDPDGKQRTVWYMSENWQK